MNTLNEKKLNPIQLLEEIRFRKIREREYAGTLRELVPGLKADYANLLRSWEPVLGQTEYAATQWITALLYSPESAGSFTQEGIRQLVQQSAQQTEAFIGQITAMQTHNPALQANLPARELIRYILSQSDPITGWAQDSSIEQAASLNARFQPEQADANNAAVEASSRGNPLQGPDTRPQTTAAPPSAPVPIGKHTLPPLPYAYNALEPYIDEATMRIHHDKHHQSYVDGLNNAENKLAEARRSGDFSLVKHWERELAFNGAGHYLHTLFWNIMAPKAGGPPTGLAAEQIRADFGSFDAFKKQFTEAADKVEGGGWAIWVWSPRSQRTEILTAEKHQNLSQWDAVPLLALDVWEHAYYLKHQNKRADYIKDWWNVVNWAHVNERLAAARKLMWQPF